MFARLVISAGSNDILLDFGPVRCGVAAHQNIQVVKAANEREPLRIAKKLGLRWARKVLRQRPGDVNLI